MNDPGRALRRMRALRGMKQSHLAELLGVTQSTVSRWERGALAMSTSQEAAARRLLRSDCDPARDAALKRLVENSTLPVHLICDRTHRLLAASQERRAAWRTDPGSLFGRSMLVYASSEILAAEARLEALGWHDGALSRLAFDTGANDDPSVPIRPGRVLWERIALADGTTGRLVTTLTPP